MLSMGKLGILDPRQGASTPRQGVPYRRGKQFKDLLRSNFYMYHFKQGFVFASLFKFLIDRS